MHDEKFEDAAMDYEREQQWEYNQRKGKNVSVKRSIPQTRMGCPKCGAGWWYTPGQSAPAGEHDHPSKIATRCYGVGKRITNKGERT